MAIAQTIEFTLKIVRYLILFVQERMRYEKYKKGAAKRTQHFNATSCNIVTDRAVKEPAKRPQHLVPSNNVATKI